MGAGKASALCLQGTSLECSFGLEESFEAVWVNESLVRCNQVVVSCMTPAEHRSDPLSLLSALPHMPLLFVPPSPAVIHLGDTLAPRET